MMMTTQKMAVLIFELFMPSPYTLRGKPHYPVIGRYNVLCRFQLDWFPTPEDMRGYRPRRESGRGAETFGPYNSPHYK